MPSPRPRVTRTNTMSAAGAMPGNFPSAPRAAAMPVTCVPCPISSDGAHFVAARLDALALLQRREERVDHVLREDGAGADLPALRVGDPELLLEVGVHAERLEREIEHPRDARLAVRVEHLGVRDVEPGVGDADHHALAVGAALASRDVGEHPLTRAIEQRMERRRDLDAELGMREAEGLDARRRSAQAPDAGHDRLEPVVLGPLALRDRDERADHAGVRRERLGGARARACGRGPRRWRARSRGSDRGDVGGDGGTLARAGGFELTTCAACTSAHRCRSSPTPEARTRGAPRRGARGGGRGRGDHAWSGPGA